MGNCCYKQKQKNTSVIKLSCPYCHNYDTFNVKQYEDHIDKCIELDKFYSLNDY